MKTQEELNEKELQQVTGGNSALDNYREQINREIEQSIPQIDENAYTTQVTGYSHGGAMSYNH